MHHRLLRTLAASLLLVSYAAQADVTVFGHLDTSVAGIDTDENFVTTGKMPADWTVASTDSDDENFYCTTCSLGFKGSEDLGNGLKAIFKLDFQYDTTERNTGKASAKRVAVPATTVTTANGGTATVNGLVTNVSDSSSITDRDQWLGLAGNFGQVRIDLGQEGLDLVEIASCRFFVLPLANVCDCVTTKKGTQGVVEVMNEQDTAKTV